MLMNIIIISNFTYIYITRESHSGYGVSQLFKFKIINIYRLS